MTLSKLRSIRKQVGELRAALLASSLEGSAEEIDARLAGLQEAATALGFLQSLPQVETLEPGSRRELETLARELSSIGRLIERGREFLDGWARLLASNALCYRPDGEPISPAAPASISVRG
jgi:hypothetical protein